MIILRSLAYHVYFFGGTAIFALSSLFFHPLTSRYPGWPGTVARSWSRSMLAGLRLIVGIEYRVEGREHLPEGPALIASMHQSAFDTLVWLLIVHNPAYVLKIELMRIPLFGAMCRLTGMIAVDRSAGGAAIRTLIREAELAASHGRKIVIFPEGTRVAPGVSAPLHPGIAAIAAHSGLPVIPVLTDSGRMWGRRAFLKRPGLIRILIQPPLPVGMPRRELMQTLSDRFAAGITAAKI